MSAAVPATASPEVLPSVLTAPEYAALVRLSVARVNVLCQLGRIAGATKVHGRWLIPSSVLPAICVPVPPPEDRADHKRRGRAAADRLATM